MNSKPFKAAVSDDAFDNWLIASTGNDDETGKDWYVTTDGIHASELHRYSQGPKADAELIAKLLNEHYAKQEKQL